MTSLAGKLLVASPNLDESEFARTVILVLQHGIDGATGVILNRPSTETIGSFWSEVSELPCDVESRLNFGGPLSAPVVAVHDVAQLGEFAITEDDLCRFDQDNFNAYGGVSFRHGKWTYTGVLQYGLFPVPYTLT